MAPATNPKTIQTPALDLIGAAFVAPLTSPAPASSCAWHRRRTTLSLLATPSDMALAQAALTYRLPSSALPLDLRHSGAAPEMVLRTMSVGLMRDSYSFRWVKGGCTIR
jgi:hypothetical protein